MSKKTVGLFGMVAVGVLLAVLWRHERTPHPVLPAASSSTESAGTGEAAPETVMPESGAASPKAAVREALAAASYDDRLQALVRDMPEHLDPGDSRALESYLLVPQPGKDGDFRQHEYALRNYMMDVLRKEDGRLGETIGTLAAVYADEAQGNVMRGYALQHLASVHIDHVADLSAADKSRIVKTLEAALGDTSGNTLASAALTGLQDISRWDPATVAPSAVASAAMKQLESAGSSTLAKISAFQIGGELKLKTIGPHARATAFDENADRVLRMSAVYALGRLGETDGLETLLNDSGKNVKKAALAALNAKR